MLRMIPKLHSVRVLSDGRPGHENQTMGLAQALSRRTGARIELVHIKGDGYLARYRKAVAHTPGSAAPQLLIGAGHATHLPVLFASRRFGARGVIVMKPTWPLWWFDLCLVPGHDLRAAKECRGIVRTHGALNRIPEIIPTKQPRGIMLIGGPSKHYGWAEDELRNAIFKVAGANPELEWVVGDSRRTPEGFLSGLKAGGIGATCVPWQQTAPDWLPTQLLAAQEAWVTEDSISMLHEAVTAGARTGVLPAPPLRNGARVLNAVRGLVADGYATRFSDWEQNGRRLTTPKHLHETGRCADLILERFFSER